MGSQSEIEPTLCIAIYEENTNRFIACTFQDASVSGSKDFVLDCVLKEGKKYILKAFLWNGNLKPLSMFYRIDLS